MRYKTEAGEKAYFAWLDELQRRTSEGTLTGKYGPATRGEPGSRLQILHDAALEATRNEAW